MSEKFHRAILTPILAISFFFVAGQHIERYNSFSYTVNDGMLQSTMMAMAVDQNNYAWFSFPNGIQKFDGRNFIKVPVQPGLPDDKMVGLLSIGGDIYLSHIQGISKYEINSNSFVHVYSRIMDKPAQFIGEDDGIIYFHTSAGTIAGMDRRTFRITSEVSTGFTDISSKSDLVPKFSDNIINHRVAIGVNTRLYLWDLKEGRLIHYSDPIESYSQYLLRLKNENEAWHYTYDMRNALRLCNFVSGEDKILYVKGKDDKAIGRCVIYPWRNKILLSFSDRLYEADTSLQAIKCELVDFQNQPIAGNSGIWKLQADNFGNLWIITIQDGVRKLIGNNYPLKYYGTDKLVGNKTISVFADKVNNRVFAGTSRNGLLVFDTSQKLIRHIKTLPGQSEPFSVNNIIKTRGGKYLLFLVGQKNIWQLGQDLLKLDSFKIYDPAHREVREIDYFGNPLYQDDKIVINQSQGVIYKTDLASNITRAYEVTTSYAMGGLFYHGYIITHANDELLYVDTASMEVFKRVPLRNTSYVRCFVKGPDDLIYIGSNKGIFKIDSTGKVLYQLTKDTGLPDDCIYSMVFDNDGYLWCSTNRGICKINKDNSVLQLTKADGLQENEFNTNVVQKTADGELYFGGVNGVSSFYPSAISSYDEKINLFFTHIKVNNEELKTAAAIQNVERIDLNYDQNSLSFDFIAMASNNPGQYIYQYMMKGVDKQWLQNNDLQTVHYYLQPGTYVMKIYASRFFDKDARPMREIQIVIHPPFWETWWFSLLMATIVVTVLVFVINQFNKRKYDKRIAALETEHKVRLERERISRDLHDSIGAYANAVLYNTELLEKEKQERLREELMKDLKFASKDIITSLRETIWALKQDNYSAEDCLVRIGNFVQSLARYYPQIKMEVEGNAPEGKVIHYSKALNIVRIIQEAVTNAIKHSGATWIIVKSIVTDQNWELTVHDNGRGFEVGESIRSSQGNGLENMRQRAIQSAVDLNMHSAPGEGSMVSLLIP